MAALLLATIILLLLNPWLNRGRLLFRSGADGPAWPIAPPRGSSGAWSRWPHRARCFDPLDSHCITPLGQILRRSRVDELPQVINVLRGEMSLIGPRPDYLPYAQVYCDTVPGYRDRLAFKPGISGYAQTEVGYVDGLDGIRAKVAADLHYVRHASWQFDLRIAWRTMAVVLGRQGA